MELGRVANPFAPLLTRAHSRIMLFQYVSAVRRVHLFRVAHPFGFASSGEFVGDLTGFSEAIGWLDIFPS
jgi:hypothetical protein